MLKWNGRARVVPDDIKSVGKFWKSVAAFAYAGVMSLPSVSARAEGAYPTGPEFVATMEFFIERCAKSDPERAEKYAALREVWNKAFAKHNYEEIRQRPSYREARQRLLGNDREDGEIPDLAMVCNGLLKQLDAPVVGVWNYD